MRERVRNSANVFNLVVDIEEVGKQNYQILILAVLIEVTILID